jgi:hypothetical protein
MTKEGKDTKEIKDIQDYLYRIYADLKHWYKVADDKANSIITIGTGLLGFMTIGIFVGGNSLDLSIFSSSTILKSLLIVFFVTVISSIVLSIIVLWSRLGFNRELFKRNLHNFYQKKPVLSQTDLLLFFGHISTRYPANEIEKENKKIAGETFLKELKRDYNDNNLIKSLSEEVVVLSGNITKKFLYINIAYSLLLISMTLLSALILIVINSNSYDLDQLILKINSTKNHDNDDEEIEKITFQLHKETKILKQHNV